jgi:hypothetical protein
MIVLSFEEAAEFKKDLKQLTKRWRSIPNDLQKVKQVIERFYIPVEGGDAESAQKFKEQFFATPRAAILTKTENYEIVKMRLDCASLGNDKKTRIIFIAIIQENRVVLVQLYAKNSNQREDSRRIKRYLS